MAKNKRTTAQLFYQNSRLAHIISGPEQRSLFRHRETPLAELTHSSSASTSTLFATTQSGSITNTKQATLKKIKYTPYGYISHDGTSPPSLGFNGERLDNITGHYLLGNGHRAFIPLCMRFNSADRLSPFGSGGLNAYNYCKGDPINFIDPSGRTLQPIPKAPSSHGLFGKLRGTPHIIDQIIRQLPNNDRAALSLTSKSMKNLTNSVMTNTPSLGAFGKIMSNPQIARKIFQQLPADDLIAISYTSRSMNNLAHHAAKPLSSALGSIRNVAQLASQRAPIDAANNIATGQTTGMMPAQLTRAGIDPNRIPIMEIDGYVMPDDMDAHLEMIRAFKVTQANWRLRSKR